MQMPIPDRQENINEFWYTHTMKFHTAVEMNEPQL